MQKCLKCGTDCSGVLCADCRLAELDIAERLPQRRPLKTAEPVRVEVKLETIEAANALRAQLNRLEWEKRQQWLESLINSAPVTKKKKRHLEKSLPLLKRKAHGNNDRYGGAVAFKQSQKVLAERLEYRARMAKKTEAGRDYHHQEEG